MPLQRLHLAAPREQRLEHPHRRIGPVAIITVRRDRAADRGRDWPCLEQGLVELSMWIGVGDDAAAGAQPEAASAQLERADRDAELETGYRADVTDRAGVCLAPRWLELRDHAHRLHLRRAGNRAGRERGAE